MWGTGFLAPVYFVIHVSINTIIIILLIMPVLDHIAKWQI